MNPSEGSSELPPPSTDETLDRKRKKNKSERTEEREREKAERGKRTMCYYNQKRWECGYWRWTQFSRQCPKEYRTGETCGLKLVMDVDNQKAACRLCKDIERKQRRLSKMEKDIARWREEGNKPATVERTEGEYGAVQRQMYDLQMQHYERVRGVC